MCICVQVPMRTGTQEALNPAEAGVIDNYKSPNISAGN